MMKQYPTRKDLIFRLVLQEIGDDYEEINHILDKVRKVFDPYQLTVSREEIYLVLSELFRKGMAGVYLLSATAPKRALAEMPTKEQMEDCYFLITPDGLRLHESEFDWPFDAEGQLLPAWVEYTNNQIHMARDDNSLN